MQSSCETELRTIARMRGDGRPELSIAQRAADEIHHLKSDLNLCTELLLDITTKIKSMNIRAGESDDGSYGWVYKRALLEILDIAEQSQQ